MTAMVFKSRFCPSPTGLIHLGNARTALFSSLAAQKNEGIFLLRIEDTDKTRSDEKYTVAMMNDLVWLGLLWQEGPEKDLGHGPYWQSQRQAIYDKYYHQLEEKGLAYPCFCTEQQLALMRKVQRASGKPPRYAGTCKVLTKAQIAEKVAQGLAPALRFAVPSGETIVFDDLVRGKQQFDSDDIGDFIIRRMDGTSPFMFCNAIDDALMEVTHVLRGEDHLTNTPRQLMILRALNLAQPHYGHMALIVGSDGSPLSKRHGSRSIVELREEGFLPLAVVNYLARLGHYYEEDKIMPLAELAENFSLENLGKSPARYDFNQLLRWQKEVVMRLEDSSFWEWISSNVHQQVPEEKRQLFIAAIKANIVFPKEALHWANIFFDNDLGWDEEKCFFIQQAGAKFFEVARDAVKEKGADFSVVSSFLKQELNVQGKGLFQPLRISLTGELHGPEMVKIFELLGKEKIITRLQQALSQF